ncbi:MAG: hypothetical protein Q9N34_10600 [Aquificota bacterium]|nr:hypothetical protein [Aquificota bacterium]
MGEKFSAVMGVLVVLEDLYKLEKASVSLGLPIPKDTVPEAKRRILDRIQNIWRHIGGPDIGMEVVAGDLKEEVFSGRLKDRRPDLIIWGVCCHIFPLQGNR